MSTPPVPPGEQPPTTSHPSPGVHPAAARGRVRRLGRARPGVLAVVASIAVVIAGSVAPADAAPTKPPTVTGDARVDQLLAKMTLDEKLTMIEGAADLSADPQYQAGTIAGIPRLGIPTLKLSDGPPGVITKYNGTGMTATMGLAATFSRTDAHDNGTVIGRDARSLGQDVVLEPFVNMDRDTSWSRGFNTFGEDPLLTSETGAAQIKGIQAQGIMAQVKHFIAYDGGNNVTVDSQTLHEIYLAPFAAAVDAGVASVMCSYNTINGPQACASTETLTGILRNELGFKGFVTSDWGGNHATTSINAGLDMEQPGTGLNGFVTQYFSPANMKAAIASGSVQEANVTRAAGHILYEYDQFGLLDGKGKHSITPLATQANQAVVQRTGTDAATLLQNTNSMLPITDPTGMALIGPGAAQTIATDGNGGAGEGSGGQIQQQVGTRTVLAQRLGANAPTYAVGGDLTGTPVPAANLSHDGMPGLLRTTPNGGSRIDRTLNFTNSARNALPNTTAITWTGELKAPTTGSYSLNLQALGAAAKLTVDGKVVDDLGGFFLTPGSPRYGYLHATDGNSPVPTPDGIANQRAQITLTAGQHTITVVATPDKSGARQQVRLNWVTPQQTKANHDAAVNAAKKAKKVVLFAWAPSNVDLSQPLPDGQDQLIADVAAVNRNVAVVLNTSQPVAMPWLSKVKSVVEMWYPGDRGGYATADILTGRANPGGRLPFTWPTSITQEVAHQASHPERTSAGVDGQTTYSEGLNIGYRFFAATNQTPLYPFGYGLSYTTFKYTNVITAPTKDGGLDVRIKITNTGARAGDIVPQVYLGAPATIPTGAKFAPTALAAYDRIHLEKGQSRNVTLHVALRQLQYWSTAYGWLKATGPRTITLANSATAAAITRTVTIS